MHNHVVLMMDNVLNKCLKSPKGKLLNRNYTNNKYWKSRDEPQRQNKGQHRS